MRRVTESDERALGIEAWLCDCCKHERQTLPTYPERKGPARPARTGLAAGRHSRDPRLFGIVRRRRRWEARIAGGRAGLWLYVGLFTTMEAAIEARDRALTERRQQAA